MSYSLFELNEFIRRVLALNLSEPVWVKCELAQVNISRGHAYLGLVEKSEDGAEIIAQGGGVIWQKKLHQLRKKLGLEFDALLREGMQVLLQVKVDFHERYGLKLLVEDIDPAYSLGQMELQKKATIQQLKSEGLLDKNRGLSLPTVTQNLAIISSETAAGLQDFFNQIKENIYGYQFKMKLFPAAMQGANTSDEVVGQMQRIEKNKQKYDAIIIIRGGGSKLDLAAFDSLGICRAVANSSLPVIAGIGHEIDETVLDLVAHTSLKTPTAVAEFILQRCLSFESELLELGNFVNHFAAQKITDENARLQQMSQLIEIHSLGAIKRERMMLEFIEKEVPLLYGRILKTGKNSLDNLSNSIELLRPESAFKRGFSLTSQDGKIITSSEQLKTGDEVLTQLKNGILRSTVKEQNDG